MSFPPDGQRRYGHVPPVQYPVDNANPANGLARQPSFNTGDDSAGVSVYPNANMGYTQNTAPSQSDGELFLPAASAAVTSARGSINHGYNPQTTRANTTSGLPYHPSSSVRYGNSPTIPYGGGMPQQQPGAYPPYAYNPAAYVGTNTGITQHGPTYHNYRNYTPTHSHSHSHSHSQYTGSSPSISTTASSLVSPATSHASASYTQNQGWEVSHSRSLSHGGVPTGSMGGVPILGAPVPGASMPAAYNPTPYGQFYEPVYARQPPPVNGLPTSPAMYLPQGETTPYPISNDTILVGPAYNQDPTYYNNANSNNVTQSNAYVPPQNQDMYSSETLARHPTNAPLPSRPVNDYIRGDWGANDTTNMPNFGGDEISDELVTQDSLMKDIQEMTLNGHQSNVSNGISGEEMDRRRWQDSPSVAASAAPAPLSSHRGSDAGVPVSANGQSMPMTLSYDYGEYTMPEPDDDSDSDSMGQAGIHMMEEAEREEKNHQFSNMPSAPEVPPRHPTVAEEQVDDTYVADNDYSTTQLTDDDAIRSQVYRHHSYKYGDDENKPGFEDVDVDYGNTGGLHDPTAQRGNDYEEPDVEEEEEDQSSIGEEYGDMFFHPGFSQQSSSVANRPLPTVPLLITGSYNLNGSIDQYGHSRSGSAIDGSDYQTLSAHVERASSMNNHSHTPAVIAPTRSHTDAGDARRSHRTSFHAGAGSITPQTYDYETLADPLGSYDIPLPQGRKRRFVPSKLVFSDIRKCTKPWALSNLASWLRDMTEGELDLKRKMAEEGLVVLFTAKVPTMNIADAETLGAYVVEQMLQSEVLVPEEEWVKFGSGTMSGVLWQLTGSGCYAPKLHTVETPGRCYSHYCARTLKKANLDNIMSEDFVKSPEWDQYYKITPDVIEAKGSDEAKRQRILHEVITSEEGYMNQLEVLRILYRDQLRNMNPSIIPPQTLEKFVQTVFGKVDVVQSANKDNLLAQLKYRQQEQGPWVSGVSDLFREWIRKARDAYLAYAAAYPKAELLMRQEQSRNLLFRNFLDEARNHKRSERLEWTTFLKAPITRLQRYTLLLQTVVKHSEDGEEKVNLGKAIEEIHKVTLECDVKVAEVQKEVTIKELTNMIRLRSNIHSTLNLDHLGRELLMQGDLQRTGSKNMSWVNTHALLFDHYLILSKLHKDNRGELIYDVSKEPIPMPLLVLESANDDPITKQKGITAPLGRQAAPAANQMSRTATPATGMDPAVDDGKILYPFRIKHLGHEIFTLYASSAQARSDWCAKITEAKTRHAKALRSQNAEPFRLRVLADSAFSYDSAVALAKVPGVPIKETPLDTAIRDLESIYGPGRGPAPVCRGQVNCATGFSAFGKSVIAIGTDIGVFISDATNPRGWTKTVTTNKVTQIAVLEEFSVCLIITERSLLAYPLDVVAPVGTSFTSAPNHNNPKKAPQKLAKDVSFFAAARMKDRMLVFYKRKEGVHNTFFKVLEPVYHKSAEKRTRLFNGWRNGGTTESFRDYDEFYLPVECYSLNLFHSYIAVSTAKGFELLTLDKKQPVSIPDLKQPAINNIATRVRDQKPLGMFRLNDQEFLLAYEDCAVYVDKHGDVSRTLIMEYSGKQKKARAATLCGKYLLLFNEDYVEVRNAENGRLRQIIAGRDVRCLDYGARGPTGSIAVPATQSSNLVVMGQVDSKTTVKIAMTHPEFTGMQIVLEMVLNNVHAE